MSFLRKLFIAEDEGPAPATGGGSPASTDDVAALLASLNVDTKPADTPKAAPAPAPVVASATGVQEESFDAIYKRLGVPPVAFPAERLLTLIAGLAALPPAQQKIAINAMDAADDTWELPGVLADARTKIGALDKAGGELQASLSAIEQDILVEAARDLQTLTDFKAELQKQIAELQAQIAEADTLSRTSEVERATRLQKARDTAAQQTARLRAERDRLSSLLSLSPSQE